MEDVGWERHQSPLMTCPHAQQEAAKVLTVALGSAICVLLPAAMLEG